MQSEINALEQNQTWVVTDLSDRKSTIGCKYVFKIKYNSDGLAKGTRHDWLTNDTL